MTIRMFEAFAGYGSQALAMEMARIPYKSIGISEIKPEALTAYWALHGYVRNYGDISKVNWDKVPDFDLFTYSFPCTDISRIGDKAGLAEGTGTSSSLLWECEKAILAKRPKWLLMENVSDLLSAKFRSDFEQWLARLETMGYNNYYKVINAKDYIPQNRERIFMVSVLKEYDRGFEFNANPQRTRYKQLSDILLPLGPPNSYLKGKAYIEFMRLARLDDIPHSSSQVLLFGHSRDEKGHVVNFHKLDCAHCCTTGSVGGGNVGMYVYNPIDKSVRKFTAFEQMRLMGLEDKDIQSLYHSGLSPNQIGDLGGNSIVVDIMSDIFSRLYPSLTGTAPERQRKPNILTLFD